MLVPLDSTPPAIGPRYGTASLRRLPAAEILAAEAFAEHALGGGHNRFVRIVPLDILDKWTGQRARSTG